MGALTETPDDGGYLYNPSLLRNLDWGSVQQMTRPSITNINPGESWLVVRPLQLKDYDKGFPRILSQLTTLGNVTRTDFERQFYRMKASGGYYVTVIEDTRKQEIIGAATVIIEYKFIHECGLRARLEDVVVNQTYRGKQLGKLLVLTVTLLSKYIGCYKMSLDCKDDLIAFYKSIGYKIEPGNANSMMLRYQDNKPS